MKRVEVRRLQDQALDHRLEAQDLLDPARGQEPQLVERVGGVAAVARVDEPGLEVAALDDLARQRPEPARQSRGMHGVGRRLAVQQPGELADRPVVEQRVRDVVPRHLREVRLGQVDPERVVVGAAARRSSEWQWLSTIGIAARSRGMATGPVST